MKKNDVKTVSTSPTDRVIVFSPLLKPLPIHQQMGLHICESVSGNLCSENFKGEFRVFQFYGFCHMHYGSGVFITPDGKRTELSSGDAVLTPPGLVHWYGAAPGGVWSEDTVCFTGDMAQHLAEAGMLNHRIFHLGKVRRLLPIVELSHDMTPGSQIKANMALMQFITDIHFESLETLHDNQPAIEELQNAIKSSLDRWWTVKEMAEFCNLSIDYFRRLFLKSVGELPKDYVDKLKIAKATEMLTSSNLSLKDIAAKLGYLDRYHFSRRFKQLSGCSPQEYRNRINKN
ncbi:MAG: AraC family transcriptional regulator [Victivallaceae bacterium]|nr:AraC family transcriptional regulator [Victivallaceae bacterium]